MDAGDRIIQQHRAQRTGRVEVAPGKVLLVRRPAGFTEMAAFHNGIKPEHVIRQVVGWEGITEADLLGESVGSSSAVEWSRALSDEVVSDRISWARKVTEWLANAIVTYIEKSDAIEKN